MSMTYQEYLETPAGQLETKGELRGQGKALVKLLELRGIPVSESARSRIVGCTDMDLLDHWLARALDARSLDEIFV